VEYPISYLEQFQIAANTMLVGFRRWAYPDTPELVDWKTRPLEKAIRITTGRMIDDSMGMLAEWRAHGESKSSEAFMPVVLFAVENSVTMPDRSQVNGVYEWRSVSIPSDASKRTVQIRALPAAYRVQVAFFSDSPHAAVSLAAQLMGYLNNEINRTIPCRFTFADGVSDEWSFRVLDNSLFPSRVPTEQQNLAIITVDITFSGMVPQVVGLGRNISDVNVDTITDHANMNAAMAASEPVVEDVLEDANMNRKIKSVADKVTKAITDTVI
jgi:hypothetical protein